MMRVSSTFALSASAQRGASLIEVLIALTLVAVTMLGLLALQLRSMGLQKDSLERRNAALLATAFAERMTANFAGFENNNYSGDLLIGATTDPTAPSDCAAAVCTPAEIAARDIAAFRRQVRAALPGGVIAVRPAAADSRQPVRVTVGWRDPRRADETDQRDALCEAAGLFGPDTATPDVADVAAYRCFRIAVYP